VWTRGCWSTLTLSATPAPAAAPLGTSPSTAKRAIGRPARMRPSGVPSASPPALLPPVPEASTADPPPPAEEAMEEAPAAQSRPASQAAAATPPRPLALTFVKVPGPPEAVTLTASTTTDSSGSPAADTAASDLETTNDLWSPLILHLNDSQSQIPERIPPARTRRPAGLHTL